MALTYYSRALAEKALTYVPFGKHVYCGIGSVVNRRVKGTESIWTSYRLARMAKALLPNGGRVMDVGTAWFHHDAFLLWLVGEYEVFLFDVEDKGRLPYIRTYIRHLIATMDEVSRELDIDKERAVKRLEPLLDLKSREEIYAACNFTLVVTDKTDQPFLAEKSIDLMVSNCVLNHIPHHILMPELRSFHRMLKDDGHIYCLIGHDDHWAFHDTSANQFNYYRYSDRIYRALFESFEFHSRCTKSEWLEIWDKSGFEVEDYYPYITDDSREQIRKLPHIDARFAKYSEEELATVYSYFLLRKRRDTALKGPA